MVQFNQFDIIGDIHGHADALHALLTKLGYENSHGFYQHPTRRVIFVGDFIDRGPQQRQVLQTVMPMVQQGSALAVMGNHEFNALAYHSQDPNQPGSWLRPRTNKNTFQHLAFLQEYLSNDREQELQEVLAFFFRLPIWLELEGLRIVHACWQPQRITQLQPLLGPGNTLTPSLLVDASRPGHPVYEAVEELLKGVEYPIPNGGHFFDKDGNKRHKVRTRWWSNHDSHLGAITLPADTLDESNAKMAVKAEQLVGYPPLAPPLFMGHYWLKGQPCQLADNVACVDYSVAKGGKLVAYRWSGEHALDNQHFVYVE